MFAHGNEFGLDAVGRQELGGNARVFGADEVCFLQHGKGAQGDVGKVADGRGNDVERAGGEGVLGFLEVFLHGVVWFSGCLWQDDCFTAA